MQKRFLLTHQRRLLLQTHFQYTLKRRQRSRIRRAERIVAKRRARFRAWQKTKLGTIKAKAVFAIGARYKHCFLLGTLKRDIVPTRYFKWQVGLMCVTCRSSNIFITARHRTRTEVLTAGLFDDFKPNKKRKRTRITGMFVGYRFAERLNQSYMGTMFYQIRVLGKNAGRRGILFGLRKHKIRSVRLYDVTPLVHNGTRPRKRRRL